MSVNQKVMELQKLRHRFDGRPNATLTHLYRFRDANKKTRERVAALQKLGHRYEHNDTLDHLYRFRDAGKKQASRATKERFNRAVMRVRLMMWATAIILTLVLTKA